MIRYKKLLSFIMSLVLIVVFMTQPFTIITSASGSSIDVVGEYDYTISNPYSTVNWDTWGKYRGNTHTHSHLSDGDKDFNEMIEKYYQLGYDCLSMTDHGTVNYGWTANKSRHTEFQWSALLHGSVNALSAQRNLEITTGVGRNGRGMIDVPYGIELNGASVKKVHVNSYFVACGDGDMATSSTWPESAIQKAQSAGALAHINHVGEWSGGQDGIGAYNQSFVNSFAQLFINYSSCIGMEIVNTSDGRTRNDRYLYDQTLKVLAPLGVKMWGFCEDDSHEYGDCGRNASFFMMPSNTAANVRTCMQNGTFFASSKNAKGTDELGGVSASSSIDFPQVNRVTVDEEKDQIVFDTTLAKKARIVADGQLIDTINLSSSGDTVTFDLNNYENSINSYVRIYFTGDGGITYVQPFYLTKKALEKPFVQFIIPSTDTSVQVYDSLGNLVPKYNSNNYYLVPAGNYTYSASRQGYEPISDVPFTVTQSDIDNNVRKKIYIQLQEDSGLLSTYFHVPETIYLNTSDLRTFQYYMDRQNSTNGALNNAFKTTGNIFFKCQGATNISLSYEILNGGSLNIAQSTSSSNTLSTYISSGALSSALASNGNTQIKWTVTYYLNGTQMNSFAYTYVYSPLIGTSGSAAAAGQATTKKTLAWLHDTMHVTGAAFISGVHSISGGGVAYRFAPYGGEAVTAADGPGAAQVAGIGMNTGTDKSDGGSTHANVTGGSANLYIDPSRTTNLNQVPNLTVGLDMLYADSCDESGVTQFLKIGSTNLYVNSSGSANNIPDGSRLYYANNNTSTKVNYPINTSVTSVNVTGQIQGKKSSRTCTSTSNIPLNFIYVDKTELRNAVSNALKFAFQSNWCENATLYNNYINAIKNASLALGNPKAKSEECTTALQTLNNALTNVKLNQSYYTVEKYLDGQLLSTKTTEYSFGRNISIFADSITGAKYMSMDRYLGQTKQHTTTSSENIVFATGENYTWKIYYNSNKYNISFITSDENYSPIGGSGLIVNQNSTLVLPTNIPSKTGYDFTGWKLDVNGNTYQPGESIVWNFATDAEFTDTWTAKNYVLTYDLNGGDPSSFIGDYVVDVAYNEEFDLPDNPTRSGYRFSGWKFGDDDDVLIGGMRVVWDYDSPMTCQAQWTPENDVSYTVYYYFQNIQNNAYTFDISMIHFGKGVCDSTVMASIPEYVGFTHNSNIGKNEGVVTADGSLVLTVYYLRNVYDLTLNVEGDSSGKTTLLFDSQNIGTHSTYNYKYESAIPDVYASTSNEDLIFCGWWIDSNDGTFSDFMGANTMYSLSTMPSYNCTLTAVYQSTNTYNPNSGFITKSDANFDVQNNYIISQFQNPNIYDFFYLKNGFNANMAGTVNGFGTRSTISIYDNYSNNEQFTLIVLGDATGDGIVDAFDISKCTAACNYEYETDEVELIALDSDFDGFVDVFDLAMLNAKANFEF